MNLESKERCEKMTGEQRFGLVMAFIVALFTFAVMAMVSNCELESTRAKHKCKHGCKESK